jgi:uncharacterized protein YifE (UPF0438 family)
MKYAVVDERKYEIFEKIFDTEKEAINEAEMQWAHMVKSERQASHFYVCSCELEEEGVIDYNTVKVIKEWLE